MGELEERERRAQAALFKLAKELKGVRDDYVFNREDWTEYCQERWGMTGAAADRLIRWWQATQRALREDAAA